MSNDWFNIRFGAKHLHWEKHKWLAHIAHNSYWEDGNWKKQGAGWLAVYTIFGFNMYKGK